MIIIEDNVLVQLARNSALVREFPFLAAARQAGGCRCGNQTKDLNEVKSQLGQLPEAGQKRFKELTGFAEVKVIFRSGNTVQTIQF